MMLSQCMASGKFLITLSMAAVACVFASPPPEKKIDGTELWVMAFVQLVFDDFLHFLYCFSVFAINLHHTILNNRDLCPN